MELTAVQGAMMLDRPTAAAFLAMDAAARAETGVDLLISSPAGAWRSPEMVLDMYLNPTKYGATQGTAKPRSLGGPGSVHETGRCVDINNWEAVGTARLDALARRFGFVRTFKSEPWHYQHDGSTGGGGSGASPIERITPMSISVIDDPRRADTSYLVDLDYMVRVQTNRADADLVRAIQRGEASESARLDFLDRLGPMLVAARLNRHPSLKSAAVEIDYDALAVAIAHRFPTLTISGTAAPQQ